MDDTDKYYIEHDFVICEVRPSGTRFMCVRKEAERQKFNIIMSYKEHLEAAKNETYKDIT